MNKYQEALDYLVGELKGCDEAISDFEYRQELNSKREAAEKLLQELVDKATPKKPKNWKAEKRISGKVEFNCPVCNRLYTDRINYCSSCGQALDWSEDECCN